MWNIHITSASSLKLQQGSRHLVACTALVLIILPTGIAVSQTLRGSSKTNDAEVFFKLGIVNAEKGDYKAALTALNAAILIDPHYAEAYYHRGIIGSYELCDAESKDPVKDFEAAIQWNPRLAEAQLEVGRARKEISNLDLAIKINPKYAEAYYWRGKLRAGDALEYLDRIRSGDPPDIHDHYFTVLKVPSTNPDEAIAYLSSLIRLAIEDYTQSISLRGDYSEAYFARAGANFGLKDYQAAVDDFTRVVELQPRKAAAYEKRGLARLEMRDQDGALSDFIQSIKFAPEAKTMGPRILGRPVVEGEDSYTSHLDKINKSSKLAEAYYEEGNAYAHAWRDDGVALESFTRAIQLGLKTADVYYQRGLLISQGAKYLAKEWKGQAIKDFTQSILIDPGNPDYYYSRGMERFKSADYRAAISDFTEAIRLSSPVTDINLWRGRAYYNLGDRENAIADLTRAIQSNPESPAAYYYRGRAYDDDHNGPLAVADYLAVVHKGPPDKEHEIGIGPVEADVALPYYRGLARLTMKRVKDADYDFFSDPPKEEDYVREAGKDFAELIKRKPNWAEAYYQRWRTNNVAADLDRAIRIKPDFVEAYTARAWEGITKHPRADVDMALHIKPDWARPYYLLGKMELLKQDVLKDIDLASANSALAYFTRAIAIDPDFLEAYAERGKLRSRVKDTQGAISDFTEVIRLNPDDLDAYDSRAELRLKLKDYRGAIDDLTRILELTLGSASSKAGVGATYRERAQARYEIGDGRGSFEDCQEFRRRLFYCPTCLVSLQLANAKKADSFFAKGVNLSQRGDKNGATANFEQAARLYHAAGNMSQYQKTKYELSKL